MKILHITHSYAPLGGTEYYVYNVCNELEKRGHKNIIIYGHKHTNTWTKNSIYIENITDFDCTERKNNEALSLIKRENPDVIYLHIVNNARLIEKLIEHKPIVQYMHNHNTYCPAAFLSTRFLNCPGKFSFLCLIYCLTGNCIGCKPHYALRQFNTVRTYLMLAKKLNAIIVASEFMKQKLVENGIDKERIYIIPYFVYQKPLVENKQSDNTTPIILFVGRICKSKGLDYLIKAVKYIDQPYELVVAGDGYYLNNIKRLARKLKIEKNINFCEWLNQNELEMYYRKASVVVMPSPWPEPFGIVGIEAASYAKPLIAFNTGGINEWLKDGKNGFLIRKTDMRMLSKKIEAILYNPKLGKKLGSEGKKMAESKFAPGNHLKLLIALFFKTYKMINL